MGDWDRLGIERRRNASQLAAVNVLLALRRLERKYRESQTRWPKGTTPSGKVAGGRFADEGRAATSRAGAAVARQAMIAAVANPEVAAAAGAATLAGGAAAGIGAIGVSRAAGWESRLGGHGVTSFFGLPLHLELRTTGFLGEGFQPLPPPTPRDDECERLAEFDYAVCRKLEPENVRRVCWTSAAARLGQCRADGPDGVTARLFTPLQKRKSRKKKWKFR